MASQNDHYTFTSKKSDKCTVVSLQSTYIHTYCWPDQVVIVATPIEI
jgi:hypothetical protein